jgi:hypothetical protein
MEVIPFGIHLFPEKPVHTYNASLSYEIRFILFDYYGSLVKMQFVSTFGSAWAMREPSIRELK